MSIFKKFQPIASAFAPNYTVWDVLIAKKYLLLPWKWNSILEGENSRILEDKFEKYLGVKYAASFDGGRSGFYAILKCLNIKDYDEVILQAFTTVALPNAIQWCGARPVFVDIGEKTYNINPDKIEEKITAKTKAIIIQHTFGNPAEIEKIMEIAMKHNLFVIEDCAHSLGAEYKNKKTGTFGNAAFFSFGRDKVISSVSGGMVITNNQELGEKIKEFRDKMPYPEKSLIIKQLLHPIITFKSLHLYYFFGLGKIIMFVASKLGIITKAYTKEEKKGERPKNFPAKMPNALAEIALHQMKLIDKFNGHRIEIANLYNEKLAVAKNISLPKSDPEFSPRWSLSSEDSSVMRAFSSQSSDERLRRGGGSEEILNISLPKSDLKSKNIFLWFTILIPNKKELIKKARKNHIILGDWFPQAVGPIEVNLEKSGYKLGSCPVAEKVSSMCVNLPTHYRVDEKDVEKVAEVFEN